MSTTSTLDVTDFFCGMGGSSTGLVAAGFQVKLAADLDHTPQEAYEHVLAVLMRKLTEQDVYAIREAWSADGTLFDAPAIGLREEREEARRTIVERCEAAAAALTDADRGVAWCHLNDESSLLTRLIPGAVEVSGADSPDAKEEKLTAFTRGEIPFLVTKPTARRTGYGNASSETRDVTPERTRTMPRNALVTPLLTALVTGPLPNPSQPDPVCKELMAEPVSNRRSADARDGDDLGLTIHEGEAR